MVSYRPDIDGLRAVAILPVVLYHAEIPGFSGGFVGVDVFFVISSFLITSILLVELEQGDFSLLRFYERRARRILPALTAVIVTTFLVGTLVLLPDEMDALGKSAVATTFFASNIHFARTLDYFGPVSEIVPLLHSWSLAVEEQFYLLFPLLLLVFHPAGRRASFGVLAILSGLSLLAAIAMLPQAPNGVFYLSPFRAWELGIGALLAFLPARARPAPRLATLLSLTGLAAIIASVVFYDHATAFPGFAALPPVLGAVAILHAGNSPVPPVVTRLLSRRLPVWIGLVSYSLYLWHWPLMALLRSARGSVTLPLWLGILAVLLSFLLAGGSYRFIEQPFRRRPPRGLSRPVIFSFSAASLGLTAGLGVLFALSDGAPGRLPDEVRAIAAAARDTAPRRAACFDRMPDAGLCSLGEPGQGRADFLLWGDSHALSLMPGLDVAARRAGLSGLFVGQSACLPVPGLRRVPEDPKCTALNRAVLAFLEGRDDLPLVILAGRWTLSVEGTRFGEEAGTDVRLARLADRTRAAPLGNADLVETALGETIADLRDESRRVLILGPVPEPGWNVPLRLAKSALALGPLPPAPLNWQDYLARAGRTERMLDRLAQVDNQVTHAPLSVLLCGATCRVSDAQGIPIYSDDDHLTRSASETLLGRPLARILADAAG
ncbi:acyltransferase family protein [Tropicimonas sp. TH_r6]|uniref:acyltransferase family protein n=1 Tax=Tropicimonas sp. TH_r6 TaxID=3082085 RepID=UPI002955B665|nr:acyltransferase family protein [Tropicimonas sp. TH_r6]MDV7141162.1 acyltransferase family protein [Tropicimonas sp. TH_r6]